MKTSSLHSWRVARSRGAMVPGAVLFHAPSHAFQAPGGGENQLVQTGRHLEDLGVAVRLFSPWRDKLGDARLLHLFGMSREGLELARVARSRGIPVVLSPICWYEPKARRSAKGPVDRVASLAKWALKRSVPRWPSWRRALLELSDAILPNSDAEARQLIQLFGADWSRVHVVPNGVASTFAHTSPEVFRAAFGLGDFVLYAGRIEPRKNVLGLIQAVELAGLPLVVIGSPPPGHEGYASTCREASRGFARWIDALDADDPLLGSAYASARVFALPSWFETPGLAALEAALAGCAVVVTPFGCPREYFGDRVEYARPDRPSEIVRALIRAWESGPHPRLASHVGSHYLWSDVAQRTVDVYDQIVE